MPKKKPQEKQAESNIKLVKITNPMWMQVIAPRVAEYVSLLNIPYITYESMQVYLTGIVQFGADAAEFWIAFKEDQPVGFCAWMVLGHPNIGVVHCDQIYIWDKDQEISMSFGKQFLSFAESKRAPYIHGLLINKKVADHFSEMGGSLGISVIESGKIELYGRR